MKSSFLKVRDEAGRVLDFHSLRHTCGSWLAARGVHPKVIQRIMRHSTITLTMDRYTHLFKGDETAALATLPDLSGSPSGVQRATGTDGEGGVRLAQSDGQEWTNKDLGEQENAAHKTETAFEEPPIGLEPMTCGLQNRCSTN